MSLHEEKVELLRKVDIFTALREYELDTIAKNSEMVHFNKGDMVFQHGTPAEDLYVVERGRVGIIDVECKDNVRIAQINPGESFGELEFFGRTGRSATAFAEDNTVLLRFPVKKDDSQNIFLEHAYVSANMLYRLLCVISERIWLVGMMLRDKTQWLQDLKKQLLCDRTTGLYNQTFLKEDFVNLLPDMGDVAAIIMIKPDNFKEVNDRFGHAAGDHVLKLMAIFLESELGENDIGIRYGGDVFAAVLPGAGRDSVCLKAGSISDTFKAMDLRSVTGGDDFRITVSIGVSLYPQDAADSKSLVESAYERLQRARHSGGDKICI